MIHSVNYHSIPTLLGAIFALVIGSFVLYKNKSSNISISFFLFCFSLFGWLFGYTIVYSAHNIAIAFIGTRIACAFAGFTAPAFYHLSVIYLNKRKEIFSVIISYCVMSIFFIMFLATNLCLTTPHKYSWGYYSHAVFLHPLFLVFFFGYFLRGFYLLYTGWREKAKLSEEESTKITCIFIAYFIALLGAIDYIPKYGIDIYPFGWLFEIIFVITIAFVITKTELFDIRLAISRTAAYGTSILTILALGMGLIYFNYTLFHNNIFILFMTVPIFALLSAIIFKPIRTFIQTHTEFKWIKDTYDATQIEAEISSSIIPLINKKEILLTIADNLKEKIQLSFVDVYLHKNDQYESLVLNKNSIAETNKLIKTLLKEKKVLIEQNIQRSFFNFTSFLDFTHSRQPQKFGYIATKPALGKIYIPIFTSKTTKDKESVLEGIIILGPKASEYAFQEKEFFFLANIATQARFALDRIPHIKEIQDARERAEEAQSIAEDAQKRAEIARAHAEEADKAKAEFLERIQHELNTPLNQLQGMHDLVYNKIITKRDEAFDTIKMIKPGIDRLTDSFTKLKTAANIITKQLAPKNEEIVLKDFVRSIQKIFKRVIREKKEVKLTIHYKCPENQKLILPKNILEIVFYNILDNAYDFTSKGKIDVMISINTKSSKLHFEFKDTGKGIAPDKLDKIFLEFSQEEAYSTRDIQGFGLGMFLCQKSMALINEKIEIKSQPKKGTTVRFSIPVEKC